MSTPIAPYTKFGFDTEFFELVPGQQGSVPANPNKPLTKEQQQALVEEARQAAYADGYAAGLAEGQQQAQADLAQLQQHLQNTLLTLQTAINEREEHLLMQCLSLLRVSLHHVVGHAANAYGPELLEHHLRALLPLLKMDETLTLKIHPAARGFHEKLGLPQAAIMGLPMHIAADPALGQTDAVIQWANGGVESKLAQHLADVDKMLAGAGTTMLPTDHKPNLNVTPSPVVAASARIAEAVPDAPLGLDEEATRAAKARADALLGDDDDMVDALK